MGKVTGRYDWQKLLVRARHVPIAPDKRAEGRAILADVRRILSEVSDEPVRRVRFSRREPG